MICLHESIRGGATCARCGVDVTAYFQNLAQDRLVENKTIRAEVERLRAYGETAPVQGHEPIPWSVHLRAYEGYVKRHGNRQSAERIAERGGFGIDEMDVFRPAWRSECEELLALRTEVKMLRECMQQAEKERDALRAKVDELNQTSDILDVDLRCSDEHGDALRAEVERLSGVLRDIEWRGYSEDGATCPSCGESKPRDVWDEPYTKDQHAPGCQLAAVLYAGR